jgi:hypothetical protein
LSFDYSLDRREAILERLLQIGQAGISGLGIQYAIRNRRPAQTGNPFGVPRPAWIIYDGGARNTSDPWRHKIPMSATGIWEMRPQIMVLLANRDTVENENLDGAYSPVGPELSRWMNVINDTVTNDDVLIDLVTPNGGHVLSAFETDLMVGRHVGAYGAWLMMLYAFRYPVFPSR